MRTAEGKIEIRSLDCSTETDALDLKILGEAGRYASDHVVDDTANRAVKGAVLTLLGGAGNDDGAVFGFQRDACRNFEIKFAFRAFDFDVAAVDFDFDFLRQRDWFESDS